MEGVERCQGYRAVLNVAGFMAEADLVGKTLKVTESLPDTNGFTEGAVTVHNEELRMLTFLPALDDAITGNGNADGIRASSWVWKALADGSTKDIIALHDHSGTISTTSHGFVHGSMVILMRSERAGIVCAGVAVKLRGAGSPRHAKHEGCLGSLYLGSLYVGDATSTTFVANIWRKVATICFSACAPALSERTQ